MRFIWIFFALMIFALNCQTSETGMVSGNLDLSVPGNSSAFVSFKLVEIQSDGSKVILEKQAFLKAKMPVMPFSINFNPEKISSEMDYKLAVIVASDPKGSVILERHEFPVITHGYGYDLNIAIGITPEPIE